MQRARSSGAEGAEESGVYVGVWSEGWCKVCSVADVGDNSGGKRQTSDYVKVESMVQLAIALPAACLIGWLIGAWFDRKFGQSWCGLVGIGVGAVAGFVQIFTTASRILNRGK